VKSAGEVDRGPPRSLVRDRLTWLGYISLSAYAFCLYALGPVTSFLRQELHLSYTLTSWHSALWALAAVATGLSFDALTRRLGRWLVLWLAAATLVVGVLLFEVGHSVAVTLPAAAVLGLGGTFLGAASVTALSDRHGPASEQALVEANVGASITAVAVPALLGLLAATAAGWRAGLLLPALTVVALWALLRRVPLPAPAPAAAAPGRLSGAFWRLCVLVALAVAVEFCIVFYGVPLLTARAGLSTAAAAAMMSLFFAGELAGRFAGSRLARRPGRAQVVIGVGLVVAMAGFLVLWWAPIAPLAGAALFVAGLGVANLYPLSIAMALAAGEGMTDRAMARTQVALGLAILVAPLLLGVLSDRLGVLRALAVEPGLIVVAGFTLLAVRRRPSHAARPAAA
jgi:predicted MFS family arabinose efflux permease